MLRAVFPLLLLAAPSSAELAISFVRDASAQTIVLENRSECAAGPFEFSLDLKGAAGRLVFEAATTAPSSARSVSSAFEGAVVAVVFGVERMDAPFGAKPRLSLPAALRLS